MVLIEENDISLTLKGYIWTWLWAFKQGAQGDDGIPHGGFAAAYLGNDGTPEVNF